MKHLLMLSFLLAPGYCQAFDSPKALQDAFLEAVRANDAAAIAECYSENATNFPIDLMVEHGPAAVEKTWDVFFERFTVVDITLNNNQVEVREDLATAWGLFVMHAIPAGTTEAIEMSGRYMDVSLNKDGRWLYIADHASVPLLAE